jgi:D-alanyl-D-alanine carboxypeptidase/D-alanyl-D-alanine-endopeptidase (penicillin-binding protein 4)
MKPGGVRLSCQARALLLSTILATLCWPLSGFSQSKSSAPSPSVQDRSGSPAFDDRAPADLAELPDRIDAKLPALPLDPDQVSVYVQAVDADHPRLAFNPEVSRAPASVIKLLTVIAGLDLLGRDYRWPTRVYVTGSIEDGRLAGDLIVKGFGDPYLSNAAYAAMVRDLRAKGIRDIGGNLVFDETHLAAAEAKRGDFDDNPLSSYNALPAAIAVNRQVTDIVAYADRAQDRVGLYTDPPLSGVDLVNDARLVQGPCRGRNHRVGASFSKPADARPRIRLFGSFASECPDERIPRLLLEPAQHAASAFHALWLELGGRIDGRIIRGTLPAEATLFHEVWSPPLADLIWDIDKYSNNLMARQVFLALGVERDGPPGTLEKARAVVADWLVEIGIPAPELLVDNGSGLSRETVIQASTLGRLLVWAYGQPFMPELLSSMSIPGVDGTTARRLRAEPIAGRAHLKTGTVRNASCIAGYVLDRDGRRWAVVVLVNAADVGQRLVAWHGHAVHHEVLRWVYDGAPAD